MQLYLTQYCIHFFSFFLYYQRTKQVAVTKFVYKDTYESNVISLHEQIASGAITFNTKSIPKAAAYILLKDV